MKNPLISVIIPSYQHAETISVCIDSILEQTYKNIEIIVVNDGSTDNTIDVLKKYEGNIILINQENQGANPARNRGLKEASGEYVIFSDADVRMKSHMLETMFNKLQVSKNASFVYSSFYFGWKRFNAMEFSKEEFKKRNLAHTTSLVRKADFPGFDDEIKRLQDWDVWLTMIENSKVGVKIDEVLFSVDISGESRIGSSWLPKFLYLIPWHLLPWKPKRIKKYMDAYQILKNKHQL